RSTACTRIRVLVFLLTCLPFTNCFVAAQTAAPSADINMPSCSPISFIEENISCSVTVIALPQDSKRWKKCIESSLQEVQIWQLALSKRGRGDYLPLKPWINSGKSIHADTHLIESNP